MTLPPTENEEELELLPPEEEERGTMNFLDHLEELRWTLFKCGGIFLVAILFVAIFFKFSSGALNLPFERAQAKVGVELGGLVTNSPMGVFSVLVQICFLGGFGLSLPFMILFLAQFIAPALKKNEILMLLPASIAAFFLFLAGAAFSYFFIVPEALTFSMRLNQMLGFEILWTADKYYGLLVWTILALGFCFQFPLIVYLLVHLGIVNTKKLVTARPYMIVFFFFLGALLTPTWDPVTQALVAIPMWLLYEGSLFLARRLERRRERELEEALADDD